MVWPASSDKYKVPIWHQILWLVLQGIYARAMQGNASAPNAASFRQIVQPLAEAGLRLALQDQ